MEPILRHFGGRVTFAGRVRTVQVHEDNVLVEEALNSINPGEVLVVDGGGSTRCALLGERIARIALDRQIAGVIIHGAIRDSVEVGGLDVGIMALTTSPKKSRKDRVGERDGTVTFGGVTMSNDDWLAADPDGVILLSNDVVAQRGLP